MSLTRAVDSERRLVGDCMFDTTHGGPRTVFEIDPLLDPRWKTLVEQHPDASVFHGVAWLQALKSCYGYVPRVVSLSPPGSPLENAFVFCEIRSPLTGKRLVSLPFSDHCEPLVNRSEEADILVTSLIEQVEKRGWKYFELRPVHRKPCTRAGLGVSNEYYFHQLDLRPSEQSLFRSFHKDCVQRKIRRAERESLRYEEGRSESLLDHFYRLHIMGRRRQGLPPQPRKWFQTLVACLRTDVQVRVAYKNGQPVASILTMTYKNTLVYKYGCSDSRLNNLGGMALLFWNAIQEAKRAGIEVLDMGRSDTDNSGLVTFKEHWGAERSIVNYWRYPARAAQSAPESRIKYVKRLVSIAPDWSLVMLGNLLYRHIG
jgi:CelD/BcsL family acetyltransferase involved in cellulose biosynthesis